MEQGNRSSTMFTSRSAALLSAMFFATTMVTASPASALEQNINGLAVRVAANASATATDSVRVTVDEVLRILQDQSLKAPGRNEERRQRLEKAVGNLADFNEISARILGKHWKAINESQKKEFSDLFKGFLSKTYANRMDEYAGGKVQYLSERRDGNYAEVKTKIDSGKTTIPMDYRLINKSGNWYAYDIIVDGISLVQNYRSQFDKIIRDSSFDGLLEELRKKQAQQRSEAQPSGPQAAFPAP